MRYAFILFNCFFAVQVLKAQTVLSETAFPPQNILPTYASTPKTDVPEAVIWSEDFANGITAGWTNAGFNGLGSPLANAQWEYRGQTTMPNISVGSRGAYAGTWGPITSQTASNGFVVFDSDYLDNGGIIGNFGNGLAPSPHIGTLTTPVINLGGSQHIRLQGSNFARVFASKLYIAFSTDGGLTWPDSIQLYSNLSANGATSSNEFINLNVSSIIGGASQARIRFVFDGTPQGLNNNGYYFWMLDDLKIVDINEQDLRFTRGLASRGEKIYFDTIGGSHVGQMYYSPICDHRKNIFFSAEVYNYGFSPMQDLLFRVDIFSPNNTLLTSLFSTDTLTIATSDTISDTAFNTFSTPFLPPPIYGEYSFIYSIQNATYVLRSDTFHFYVNDSLIASDYRITSNGIGTIELGNNNSVVAQRFDFDTTQGTLGIHTVKVGLHNTTVPGGTIKVFIRDASGFNIATGFPVGSILWQSNAKTITANDIARGFKYITLASPYCINKERIYILVEMNSNGGINPIQLKNDQILNQTLISSIMYKPADNRWYWAFAQSLLLNSPHIQALVNCCTISIEEETEANQPRIFPNPVSDILWIETEFINENIVVEVSDLEGRLLVSKAVIADGSSTPSISLENLAMGVYIVTVKQGKNIYTQKLVKM